MGRPQGPSGELAIGTLDILILARLVRGPMHGFGIADYLHDVSEDALRVEEGSLYPALHRLEDRGLIVSEWGTSENNRRARFYSLTPRGRRRVVIEVANWRRFVDVVGRIIDPAVP
jgi:transcriptional regulator